MSKLSVILCVFEKMRKGEDFRVRNCVKCSIISSIEMLHHEMHWLMKHVNIII